MTNNKNNKKWFNLNEINQFFNENKTIDDNHINNENNEKSLFNVNGEKNYDNKGKEENNFFENKETKNQVEQENDLFDFNETSPIQEEYENNNNSSIDYNKENIEKETDSSNINNNWRKWKIKKILNVFKYIIYIIILILAWFWIYKMYSFINLKLQEKEIKNIKTNIISNLNTLKQICNKENFKNERKKIEKFNYLDKFSLKDIKKFMPEKEELFENYLILKNKNKQLKMICNKINEWIKETNKTNNYWKKIK